MLTQAQILAENFTDPLTSEQVLNLTLLVKQYPVYTSNLGLFTDLATELQAEVTTPTVKTRALKAVLTALGALPSLVVESQGRSDAPSHFATQENWNSLALDVLNIIYDLSITAGLSHQSFALTRNQLTNCDLLDFYRGNTLKI